MAAEIEAWAYPRVGLLGNPSDGFGGRVIAFTFADFCARVHLEPGERFAVVGGDGNEHRVPQVEAWREELRRGTLREGAELLAAAALRSVAHHAGPVPGFRLRFETSIPRQVGLSGSSALVIAALRVLDQHLGRSTPPLEQAEQALAAEIAELGIAAGPQDRVVQAHEGLLFMDFHAPGRTRVERLDPGSLPPLFIAYDPEVGDSSGIVHTDVRARFDAGDVAVRAAMVRFAELATLGRSCLQQGRGADLLPLIDENFDRRRAIWSIRPRHLELVELGRAAGAAVKFTGSGGAVVGAVRDETRLTPVFEAYRRAGYPILWPVRPVGPALLLGGPV